jgi:membrane protein
MSARLGKGAVPKSLSVLELQRAQEHDRGRHATQPLQIPRKGWYDILWRTYQEMQQDRLLSIAGGVSFFVLLAIFPAITALVSAYGLFFNPATIANDIRQLNDFGARQRTDHRA